MGTIGDKLNYLAETKNQMKTALKSKGQNVGNNDPFRSYVGKINNLSPTPTGTINISQNGTYDVSSYANADVDVAGEPTLQSKSVTITENGTTTVTPDTGYDGLSDVDVTVNVPIPTAYPPDWSEIGYQNTPQDIIDDFNYSKDILDNWDNTQTNLDYKYKSNINLKYFPTVDMSNATSANSMFSDCYQLLKVKIGENRIISMCGMFDNCSALQEIDIDISYAIDVKQMFYYCRFVTAPQLDTSNIRTFDQLFQMCIRLENVPVYNTGKAVSLKKMFEGCTRLSNESLNNIMQMCINAISYNRTKTLKYIGLTQAQATTCQTLSNWNDFVAAGWSTGY